MGFQLEQVELAKINDFLKNSWQVLSRRKTKETLGA